LNRDNKTVCYRSLKQYLLCAYQALTRGMVCFNGIGIMLTIPESGVSPSTTVGEFTFAVAGYTCHLNLGENGIRALTLHAGQNRLTTTAKAHSDLTSHKLPPPDLPPLGLALAHQLSLYFAGTLRHFDLPLEITAHSPFRQLIWRQLLAVPYGDTCTYKTLAVQAGKPLAARAVGQAVGANPLWVLIPCHRVIGANGHLTGYAGGLTLKQTLLSLEQKN
jgi:methylated-DNA-[protein]-cysteine S-methyltransferase